jgi:hypothetical protein
MGEFGEQVFLVGRAAASSGVVVGSRGGGERAEKGGRERERDGVACVSGEMIDGDP